MKRFFVLAFIAVFMVAVNMKKLNVEEQLLAETIEDEALEELAEVEQNATTKADPAAVVDAKKKEEAAKLEKEKKAKEDELKKQKDEAEKKAKAEADKKKKEAEDKLAAEKKKLDEEKKKAEAKEKELKAAAELKAAKAKEALEKKKKEGEGAVTKAASDKAKLLELEKERYRREKKEWEIKRLEEIKKAEELERAKKAKKPKKVRKVKKVKKVKKHVPVKKPKPVKVKPLTKKDKCKALSKKAKEAAKKAKALRKKYLINCIQKAEDNEKAEIGKIEKIAKKMDIMRAKIISMIEEVKATPKRKRRPIMDKIKEALRALSNLEPERKKLAEQAKKIGQYVVSELNEEKQRLLAELNIQQRALEGINPKITRLKKRIKSLRIEARTDKEAKTILIKRAKKLSFLTRRAATIKSDIATLKNNINIVEAKIAMKTKIRVDMEKSDLSIQLENELNKVLKLDGRFTRASDKALRTRRKKDLRKVWKVAKAIQKAKEKAAKIKSQIRSAPKQRKVNLKRKLKKVKIAIKLKTQALKQAKAKLKNLGPRTGILIPQSPEEIECVKLEGELEAERHRADVITGKILQECRRNIEKERLRTDVEIKLLETKLGIAKQAIMDLQKSFDREQHLEGLREQSKQKLYKALSAKEKQIRKQAEKEVWELLQKINAMTIKGFDAKTKALQVEAALEEKGKQELVKEKKDAKEKEKKLEEDLKKKEKKLAEIIEAGKKAKDKTTKEVLEKENAAATKAIKGIKAKISKAQKENQSTDFGNPGKD